MSQPTFRAIPILRIFDLARAREFYIDFLGFRIDWEHRFEDSAPVYMQVSRGDLVLHLSEHHGDCCPGIEPTPWRSRLMEVIDPFNNRLRFDEHPPSPQDAS